jgi:hypothetical protein
MQYKAESVYRTGKQWLLRDDGQRSVKVTQDLFRVEQTVSALRSSTGE